MCATDARHVNIAPRGARRHLPVRIFSGADYEVEKEVNSFVRDVRVVDVRISSYLRKDLPRVAVLVLYEESVNSHLAAAPRGPAISGSIRKGGVRPAATPVTIPVAVWVAAATLHRDGGDAGIDRDFKVQEILAKVLEQGIYDKKVQKKAIESNITQYCVSNARPGQGNHRKLYRVRRGVYRLYRPGDDCFRGRENGPESPEPNDLPGEYRDLLEWYNREYCQARRP